MEKDSITWSVQKNVGQDRAAVWGYSEIQTSIE